MGWKYNMYECPACGERFEDMEWEGEPFEGNKSEDVLHCGNVVCNVVPASPVEGSHWGRLVGGIEGYDYTMDHNPVRVKSRAHRKAEALKRGLVIDETAGV